MRRLLLILAAALALINPALAQNYTATQGTGTTFGSKLVGGVNYPQWVLCDPTTPSQCLAVDASGRATVLVSGSVAVTGTFFQVTQPVSVASSQLAAGAGVDGWDLTQGAKADTPCTAPASSTACTTIALLKALLNTGQYPAGAVALTGSATGTTAATTATLAGTTGKTTYVCGYSIRANATANTNVTNTLTGVISGTMSSAMWVPANTAGLGVDEQIFNPCIPASTTNTGIAAVSGAPGTGGVVTSKIWGYQL